MSPVQVTGAQLGKTSVRAADLRYPVLPDFLSGFLPSAFGRLFLTAKQRFAVLSATAYSPGLTA